MRSSFLYILVFWLFGIVSVFPQIADQTWTRFETEDRSFSVAFPPGAIVDADSNASGRKLTVFGDQNGVRLVLSIFKSADSDKSPPIIQDPENVKFNVFQSNGFGITQMTFRGRNEPFYQTFRVKRDDVVYELHVSANPGDQPEIARFLYSIKLQGKPLFVRKVEADFPEETRMVRDLKTSPEVTLAMTSKREKRKIQVSYSNDINEPEVTLTGTRRAIVVEQPRVEAPRELFKARRDEIIRSKRFKLKLRVSLLADGQVGGVTVLSGNNEEYTKAALEVIHKLRFIPAKRAGVNVDSTQIVEYWAETLDLVRD